MKLPDLSVGYSTISLECWIRGLGYLLWITSLAKLEIWIGSSDSRPFYSFLMKPIISHSERSAGLEYMIVASGRRNSKYDQDGVTVSFPLIPFSWPKRLSIFYSFRITRFYQIPLNFFETCIMLPPFIEFAKGDLHFLIGIG